MIHNLIESLNAFSVHWSSWMAASLIDATVVLALVSFLWLLIRKKAPAQLGAMLFLLVLAKLFVPLELPVLPRFAAWLPARTTESVSIVISSSAPEATTRPIIQRIEPAARTAAPLIPKPAASPSASFHSWLMLVWTIGVVFLSVRTLQGGIRFRRQMRDAKQVDPASLPVDFNALQRRLGLRKTIRIVETPLINAPAVAGAFRPTLFLPESFATSLSPAQLEWVLLHELAHIRSGDVAVKCFQRIAGICYFFNPAVWIANRVVDRLREYACDDIATSIAGDARLTASEAFLAVVRLASKPPAPPALAVGVLDSPAAASAARRLNRLLDANRPLRVRVSLLSRLAFFFIALLLLPHLRAAEEPVAPSTKSPAEAERVATDKSDKVAATEKQSDRVEFNVIIAKHVMLLDGNEIITWDDLEKKIAALPNPSLAYPHYYYTNGSYASGANTTGQTKSMELYAKYKLSRSTIGSLLPRRGFFFDQIQSADDLNHDESLRIEGRVLDKERNGVSGAEVVVITPVDESIPYKAYDIYMVEGRLRNPLDEVMTHSDANGKFVLYPPKDKKYRVIAVHPEKGIAFGYEQQLKKGDPMRFLEWGSLIAEFEDDTIPELAEKKSELSASLRTHMRGEGGMPEINFTQHTSDSNATTPSDRRIVFSHIPPIFDSAISRTIPGEQGMSYSVPCASVAIIAGETRKISLGPLTRQQWQRIEDSRRSSEERRAKGEAERKSKN